MAKAKPKARKTAPKAAAADLGDRAIDAAMDLAARDGWGSVSLNAVAEACGASLMQLYARYPSRTAILAGFARRVDAQVLKGGGAADAEESPRDRLFDVMMRRYDAMKPFRAAIAYYQGSGDPAAASIGMTGFCFGGGIVWRTVTQAPELSGDGAARFLLPAPRALEKRLAPQLLARRALRLQLAVQDHVHRDRRVVGARHPERVEAVHALGADEDVLQGVDERVPEVQRAGDVGRRDDDAVRLAGVLGLGPEVPAALPLGIPARLHRRRLVAIRDRRGRRRRRRRHALRAVIVAPGSPR